MITVRSAAVEDFAVWKPLWDGYCEFYHVHFEPSLNQAIWERFLDPSSPLEAWLACDQASGEVLGFAHIVLHPHTWSLKTVCYLEDLYVKPEARSRNVGHTLIQFLTEQGKKRDWRRVYWHTAHDNLTARRLYDRFGPADPWVSYTVEL